MRKTIMVMSLAVVLAAGAVILSGCGRAAWGGMMGDFDRRAYRRDWRYRDSSSHHYPSSGDSHRGGWTRDEPRGGYAHSAGCGGY